MKIMYFLCIKFDMWVENLEHSSNVSHKCMLVESFEHKPWAKKYVTTKVLSQGAICMSSHHAFSH